MSAAFQVAELWASTPPPENRQAGRLHSQQTVGAVPVVAIKGKAPAGEPGVSLAFYRRHTERMLRRYLYASMQVGRAPSILGESIGRGWVSSRPVKTFEDVVVFVLDMERCLGKLASLDREILCRVVIQEYTQAEAAMLIGMSPRTLGSRFPQALDKLTEELLDSDLLILP